MDKKTGEAGFTIIDGDEFCCIVGSHKEEFGVVYDGIIIGDNFCRRIKELDGGEKLTVFWCDIYCAIWLSWAELDVNCGDVSIFFILYFCSVCYIAVMIVLIVCIVGNIQNRHSAIFGWFRGLFRLGRVCKEAHDDGKMMFGAVRM